LSRQALTLAAGISTCFEATLTVLHVMEPSGSKAVSDLCSWIPTEERSRCEIRELVRHGHASDEIVRLAAEQPYDMVVLGAPRRQFFEGMVLGTTAIRTVRHAPCPVLSIGADDLPPNSSH
jgi:nucleotide-binding universal stress UspA family protein